MAEPIHALELAPEEMRDLGYRVVDMLVEHFANLREKPPLRTGSRAELESRLREPLPEHPSEPGCVLRQLETDVFGNMARVNHPRFFGFIPSPGNFVGAMADALSGGFNPFVGTWLAGSGPAEVELVTTDWLRGICGLPDSAGGLFVSGGSMANLSALAVARQSRLGEDFGNARIYFSDQTHSCVERALRILGFRREQIRALPCDSDFRLPAGWLRSAVEEDRRAGRTPFCVVANAGTTNTGAVDPLPEIMSLAREYGLWTHVDGAYGAAAMLSERGRALLAGIEQADSVSLDPHKWLFQPFEIGCVLVRDVRLLRDTFRILPEYLKDAHRLEGDMNFCDHGIQLSRGFRALKLWMSLKVFGAEAFRQAVDWGLDLSEAAGKRLLASGCWEIVSPPRLAMVAFRHAGGEAVNRQLAPRLIEDGYAMLSSTTLLDRTALRLCTINPRTTLEEIVETIGRLERLAEEIARG